MASAADAGLNGPSCATSGSRVWGSRPGCQWPRIFPAELGMCIRNQPAQCQETDAAVPACCRSKARQGKPRAGWNWHLVHWQPKRPFAAVFSGCWSSHSACRHTCNGRLGGALFFASAGILDQSAIHFLPLPERPGEPIPSCWATAAFLLCPIARAPETAVGSLPKARREPIVKP